MAAASPAGVRGILARRPEYGLGERRRSPSLVASGPPRYNDSGHRSTASSLGIQGSGTCGRRTCPREKIPVMSPMGRRAAILVLFSALGLGGRPLSAGTPTSDEALQRQTLRAVACVS